MKNQRNFALKSKGKNKKILHQKVKEKYTYFFSVKRNKEKIRFFLGRGDNFSLYKMGFIFFRCF
jgi:hypothetical protein